ncbi:MULTISPECIES: GLPGLI family protein [Polaribacter]|uniref:GLPGLI family protein n=1 Tax=Polaribacter marinaquae TaxID=1642819 RepID=A0ABZ2TNS4_9FLAO
MKKKTILTLIIFINTIVFSQNISGKVTYVVSMESLTKEKIDSISKSFKKKNIKMGKWMRNIFENTPNVSAYLEFSNDESLYYVENEMQNDGKPVFNVNRTFAGGEDRYYKNIKTKEFYHESDVFDELSLIEIPIKKWKLTQESKIIGGYLCYKAIDLSYKSNSTFAWFTPEIPVSFGPKKFVDLPGLVLEVQLKRRKIIASKIILNPKEEININKPTKGKRVTAEEAKKRYSNFWNSLQKQ